MSHSTKIALGKLAYMYRLQFEQQAEVIQKVGASFNVSYLPSNIAACLHGLELPTQWHDYRLLRVQVREYLAARTDLEELLEKIYFTIPAQETMRDLDSYLWQEMFRQYHDFCEYTKSEGYDSPTPAYISVTYKVYNGGCYWDFDLDELVETEEHTEENTEMREDRVAIDSMYLLLGVTPLKTLGENLKSASQTILDETSEFVLKVLCDLVRVDKSDAVSFLYSKNLVPDFECDDLTHKDISVILSPNVNSPKTEKISSKVSRAWLSAVQKYQSDILGKSNTALPKRMEILLRRLAGASHAELEADFPGRNISRDLKDALQKDVPLLLSIFADLPPLPKRD